MLSKGKTNPMYPPHLPAPAGFEKRACQHPAEEVCIDVTLTVQLRLWEDQLLPPGEGPTQISHLIPFTQGRNNLVSLQFPYVAWGFSNI